MWELEDNGVLRFRCHVGHAFSSESLLEDQSAATEAALYVALKTMDEKAVVLRHLAERMGSKLARQKSRYEALAKEQEKSAEIIRKLLTDQKE